MSPSSSKRLHPRCDKCSASCRRLVWRPVCPAALLSCLPCVGSKWLLARPNCPSASCQDSSLTAPTYMPRVRRPAAAAAASAATASPPTAGYPILPHPGTHMPACPAPARSC